jgi:hypothetical protein
MMMTKFKLTPAIKWLEENIESNKSFDSVFSGYMFDIYEDHTCDDEIGGRCFWEKQDERNSWNFEADAESAREEIEWANSKAPDGEFDRVMKNALCSPFYNAIAQ